jgi:hypothetical protein
VFGLGLLFLTLSVEAQIAKQSLILLNSKPVLVELSNEGEIVRIIKEDPDQLLGFDIVPSILPTKAIENAPLVNQVEVDSITTTPKYIDQSDYVYFENGFATLTPQGIEIIDKYINMLKDDQTSFILLRTLSNAKQVSLSLKGIETHRVATEPLEANVQVAEVKITISKGKTSGTEQ